MISTRYWWLGALALVACGAVAGFRTGAGAVAQPATGHNFAGITTLAGMEAAAGTSVAALIDGRECVVAQAQTGGRYALTVPAASAVPGCGIDGATVAFTVGGMPAEQTAPFRDGATTVLDLTAAVAPPVTAAMPAAAPVSASSDAVAAPHRFTGTLTIEGLPAPQGTAVTAFVDTAPCGSGNVGEGGRYIVDVTAAALDARCGRPGADVRFTLTPAFGEAMRDLGMPGAFRPGATTERDIAIDLRTRTPDAENVPWFRILWSNPSGMRLRVCGKMMPEVETASREAQRQWGEASRSGGLNVVLIPEEDRDCRGDFPGIRVVEAAAPIPLLGLAVFFDQRGRQCDLGTGCLVYDALVVINATALLQEDPALRGQTIAHEIGHALGLGHAQRCNGGTIMWRDTRCRFPLTHIGVDDIASLNQKAARELGAQAGSRVDGISPLED